MFERTLATPPIGTAWYNAAKVLDEYRYCRYNPETNKCTVHGGVWLDAIYCWSVPNEQRVLHQVLSDLMANLELSVNPNY